MSDDNNKAVFIVFSGDMDKIFAALTFATGCAAAGMDTTLFFTFWGLNAIKKGTPVKAKSFLGKMMGVMNRGGINRLNPSHFSFGGIGRILFKKMMGDKKVASLEELRQTALDLGVHMLACKTSMDVLEVGRDDLIPEVEGIVGVATMIKEASNSRMQLFI